MAGCRSSRADHTGGRALRATNVLFSGFTEIIDLALDLVPLAFIRSKLFLVDCNKTFLLPRIRSHLVKLGPKLSDLRVHLANSLLEVRILTLISLKSRSDLAMLPLKFMILCLDNTQILLQLSGLAPRGVESIFQRFHSLGLLFILCFELGKAEFEITFLRTNTSKIAFRGDLLVLYFLHLGSKCAHLIRHICQLGLVLG